MPIDDPNFGCSTDGCDACPAPENVTKMSCSDGQCVVTKCDAGVSKLCDGECKRLDLPEYGCSRPGCGPCFFYKATGYACNAFGSCEITDCTDRWTDCNGSTTDGCERNLNEDQHYCGFCNKDCDDLLPLPHAGVACAGGACVISACDTGYKDCNGIVPDGCERNVQADNNNCGGCAKKCTAEQTCTNGKCL